MRSLHHFRLCFHPFVCGSLEPPVRKSESPKMEAETDMCEAGFLSLSHVLFCDGSFCDAGSEEAALVPSSSPHSGRLSRPLDRAITFLSLYFLIGRDKRKINNTPLSIIGFDKPLYNFSLPRYADVCRLGYVIVML